MSRIQDRDPRRTTDGCQGFVHSGIGLQIGEGDARLADAEPESTQALAPRVDWCAVLDHPACGQQPLWRTYFSHIDHRPRQEKGGQAQRDLKPIATLFANRWPVVAGMLRPFFHEGMLFLAGDRRGLLRIGTQYPFSKDGIAGQKRFPTSPLCSLVM